MKAATPQSALSSRADPKDGGFPLVTESGPSFGCSTSDSEPVHSCDAQVSGSLGEYVELGFTSAHYFECACGRDFGGE